MEKLKKKKKYYFPYKIFNVERKTKSQENVFEKDNSKINSVNLVNRKNVEVNNFVKKLKSTILSSKVFSKYMDNYIGQTQDFCFKSPGNTVYPIKKNFQYLPINLQKSQSIDEIDESKKVNENEINKVFEKPYGYKYKKTKIVINKDKDIYHHNSQEKIKSKIFMSFSEGNFYSNELLKTFGLNNIDINNNLEVIKNNFEYLHESIINIQSLQNFTTTNSIEFKIKNHFNNEDIQFNMNIFSLCFKFYEIKNNNDTVNIDDVKKLKKHKLYFPFKLLPFFYLLNFSFFKKFISEIIYYDKESNTMNFNEDKFKQIFKKYSFYLRNLYQRSYQENYNDITFYKNEYVYNNYYDWIIINDKNNNESIIYKMKIVFPKVIFEEKNNKIKVINHLSKNILVRVLKMNFIDWEKIVLFDLFSNKKFRYLINNILIGGKKYSDTTLKLYEKFRFSGIEKMRNTSNMNKTFNNFNKSTKNYEFFISETSKKQSYYYIFTPNIILLLTGEQKKKLQKINLNLKESRKLYELSKYWGAINTLFKCMYKDEMNNKIYFKLNILEDMPTELYRTIRNEKINMRESLHYKNININSASTVSKEKSNYMRYKSNEIELVLSDCLLSIMNINFNEAKYIYYKVPNQLLNTVLTCNDNMKIVNCIIECYNEIINNKNEIDILNEEKIMNRKLYENKRSNSPTDKNRYERHPTVNQNKFNPSKTFNKNKSFYNNNNKNIYSKSIGKQKSFMEKKNSFLNKLEKRNRDIGFEPKRKNNVSDFSDSNEKRNEHENFPIIQMGCNDVIRPQDLFKVNNNNSKTNRLSRNYKNK